MIQSAMIFALGVFASGLVWLAFSVALVRRARRLTERRLLAGIAVRRAEFETERDELRARHAVQMHRLEREVSRVVDMATAHRLEADLKERDLMNARAELVADEEDFLDIERRLSGEREVIQDLERRHAEAGAALRAAQHALKLETKRRAGAEEALDEATILADQRRLALTALRSENDILRSRLGEEPGAPVPFERDDARLPHAVTHTAAYDEDDEDDAATPIYAGGSVVPLPTRARQIASESPEQSEAVVVEANRELHRIADEANEDEGKEIWRAQPKMPAANAPAPTNIGELVALRIAPTEGGDGKSRIAAAEGKANPESRFFEALAEIRALKRAANQAGE
jgi:hypothetical protein